MLFIVIGIVVSLTITLVAVIMNKYKKELHAKDWYEEYQYEFKGVDCGHDKHIKLADTNWKFAFTLKKEKNLTIKAGSFSKTVHQIHYRFFCEECRKKRWFEQTNSVRDHKGLFSLRMKYLAIGFVSLLTFFALSMNIIFRFILE